MSKILNLPPETEAPRVDITKRYDLYCVERGKAIVYRNVLIKCRRSLFSKSQYDVFSEFLEVEQANGQTLFLSRATIVKFCEHGFSVTSELVV